MKHTVLLGCLLTLGVAVAQSTPADPNTVVAIVGNSNITLADYEKEFKVYATQALVGQGMQATPENFGMFNSYRPQILDEIVRQKAIGQYARKLGISTTEEEILAELDRAKSSFADAAEYQKAVAEQGFSDEAHLKERIADNNIQQKLFESLAERFTFNEAAMKAMYQLYKDSFYQKASSCAKHILLKTEADAKTARARLDKNETFEDVAKALSEDPGSKENGGDLGCLAPGDTVPEFDNAIFKGPLNQVQQVKTEFGVHLVVVTERTEESYQPLEEVRPQIVDYLSRIASEKYLDSQIKRIAVQKFPERVAIEAPAAPVQ